MGVIQALKDGDLDRSYVYRRIFNPQVPSPLDEEFTFETFSKKVMKKNRMLKSVLVGKDAILAGLNNTVFQDVIFRAKLHPKRKASQLKKDEIQALYDAVRFMVQERIRLNGKDQFYDLYGNQGGYTPAMDPNMKQQPCPRCGTSIEKISVG